MQQKCLKTSKPLFSLLVPFTSLSLLVSTDTVATYLDTVLILVLVVTVNTESAITQSERSHSPQIHMCGLVLQGCIEFHIILP